MLNKQLTAHPQTLSAMPPGFSFSLQEISLFSSIFLKSTRHQDWITCPLLPLAPTEDTAPRRESGEKNWFQAKLLVTGSNRKMAFMQHCAWWILSENYNQQATRSRCYKGASTFEHRMNISTTSQGDKAHLVQLLLHQLLGHKGGGRVERSACRNNIKYKVISWNACLLQILCSKKKR